MDGRNPGTPGGGIGVEGPGTAGAADDSSRQLIGADVGPYHIVEKLGEGGMGVVYKAIDRALDREVALKILFEIDEPANVKRFQQEARALAKVTHPNAIHIFWTGEFQGFPCFAMEYISEGVSVYDILRHKGVIPLEDAVDIVVQAAKGLAAARRAGIVHRDIKPNNLLIDADGTVKISDFGLAKIVEDKDGSLTQSGIVMGTPYYMSPEQGQGEAIDHRSDLYSLGATFYHMITGFTPYEAQNPVSLIIKHVKDPIPDIRTVNPQIPDAVRRIVEKCLEKNPDDRYQEYEELIEDLEAWTQGQQIVNAPVRRPRRARGGSGATIPRWAFLLAGLGFGGLLAVGVRALVAKNAGEIAAVTPTATPPVVAVEASATPAAAPSPVAAEPGELDRARAAAASTDPDERARAAATMGKLADKAALPALLKLATDPVASVRARAVWALGRISDPAALAATIEALKDEDRGVVGAAVGAVDGVKDARLAEPLRHVADKYAGLPLARAAMRARDHAVLVAPSAVFGDKPGLWWREQFRVEAEKLDDAKARVTRAERAVGYYRQRYGFTPGERAVPDDADLETKHVFRTVYAASLRALDQAHADVDAATAAQAKLQSAGDVASVPPEWRQ